MSLESRVGRAVLDMGDIIKNDTISGLARARKEGKFSVSDSDLNTIANIISSCVESSVMKSSDMMIRIVKS